MQLPTLIEALRASDPRKPVRLRGSWGPFGVDHIDAQTYAHCFVLITFPNLKIEETGRFIPDMRAEAAYNYPTVASVLEKALTVENPGGLTVMLRGPNGSGPVDSISDIDKFYVNSAEKLHKYPNEA